MPRPLKPGAPALRAAASIVLRLIDNAAPRKRRAGLLTPARESRQHPRDYAQG